MWSRSTGGDSRRKPNTNHPILQTNSKQTSKETLQAISEIALEIETMDLGSVKEGKRITQIQTDLGREFTHLDDLCLQHLWHYAKTGSYNPQANGTAESGVNITKTLTPGLLVAARLPEEFWPVACQYALESYRDKLLGHNKIPPFGTMCIVKRLKPEGEKTAF